MKHLNPARGVSQRTARFVLTAMSLMVSASIPVHAQHEPTTVDDETPAGALAFSPDGTWLAIGADYQGPLKLWKVGGTAPNLEPNPMIDRRRHEVK